MAALSRIPIRNPTLQQRTLVPPSEDLFRDPVAGPVVMFEPLSPCLKDLQLTGAMPLASNFISPPQIDTGLGDLTACFSTETPVDFFLSGMLLHFGRHYVSNAV